MSTIEQIRRKLAAAAGRGQNNDFQQDNTLFKHWGMDVGGSATLRFLPDGNEDNTYFWVERQTLELTFAGVKGESDKEISVKVPCMETWGETCPVISETRSWWDAGPDLEALARKYYKKRHYFFQGFVLDSDLDEDLPENPIRRFVMTPQIFKVIHAGMMDEEMLTNPADIHNGTNFKIVKEQKGQWADYSTSKFMRNESSLSDSQIEAIEKYGLVDLSTYLPAKPDADHVDVIKEMFDASIDGEQYDRDRWERFYKPFGLQQRENTSTTSIPKAASAQETTTDEIPVQESKVEETKESSPSNATASLLATLQQRKKAAD